MAPDFVSPVVVVGLDCLDQLVEVGTVAGIDLCKGDSRASLTADQQSKTSLAFYNAVWDAHFPAQSRKEEDELEEKKLQF